MANLRQIYTVLAEELSDLALPVATSTGSSTSEVVCSGLINATYGAKHYAMGFLYAGGGANETSSSIGSISTVSAPLWNYGDGPWLVIRPQAAVGGGTAVKDLIGGGFIPFAR